MKPSGTAAILAAQFHEAARMAAVPEGFVTAWLMEAA
jgi:hypothetical protein